MYYSPSVLWDTEVIEKKEVVSKRMALSPRHFVVLSR